MAESRVESVRKGAGTIQEPAGGKERGTAAAGNDGLEGTRRRSVQERDGPTLYNR